MANKGMGAIIRCIHLNDFFQNLCMQLPAYKMIYTQFFSVLLSVFQSYSDDFHMRDKIYFIYRLGSPHRDGRRDQTDRFCLLQKQSQLPVYFHKKNNLS